MLGSVLKIPIVSVAAVLIRFVEPYPQPVMLAH